MERDKVLELMRISIHVPREGHDPRRGLFPPRRGISIHVPREGHDCNALKCVLYCSYFNPRAPRGARQLHRVSAAPERGISIHVPREGHD